METHYTTDNLKLAAALYARDQEEITLHRLPQAIPNPLSRDAKSKVFEFYGPLANYEQWEEQYERRNLKLDGKSLFESFEYFRSKTK